MRRRKHHSVAFRPFTYPQRKKSQSSDQALLRPFVYPEEEVTWHEVWRPRCSSQEHMQSVCLECPAHLSGRVVFRYCNIKTPGSWCPSCCEVFNSSSSNFSINQFCSMARYTPQLTVLSSKNGPYTHFIDMAQ